MDTHKFVNLLNKVKKHRQNEEYLMRQKGRISTQIAKNKQKIDQGMFELKEKINMYHFRGKTLKQTMEYIRKPLNDLEIIVDKNKMFEKLVQVIDEYLEIEYIYLSIDEYNTASLSEEKPQKYAAKIEKNDETVYVLISFSSEFFLRTTTATNLQNYLESMPTAVLHWIQNKIPTDIQEMIQNYEQYCGNNVQPEYNNGDVLIQKNEQELEKYELFGMKNTLNNVFKNIDDNISEENCVYNLCLKYKKSRGNKFLSEMEEEINEKNGIVYEDMIHCFLNNDIGFTIRNTDLTVLNENESKNRNFKHINMILYNNHCYGYENMEDIEKWNNIKELENIKQKIVTEDIFIQKIENFEPRDTLIMPCGNFLQFKLIREKEEETKEYIMNNNNEMGMFDFIKLIKTHILLKYDEQNEEFDKIMDGVQIGTLFHKLLKCSEMSIKKSAIPIINGMKIKNNALTYKFTDDEDGFSIDKNKEYSHILANLKKLTVIDITKHEIIDTNKEEKFDCFYNISFNINNEEIQINDFHMYIHSDDLEILKKIKGIEIKIKQVIQCDSYYNILKEFIYFLHEICEQNDMLRIFKQMMNQFIGEMMKNLETSDKEKSFTYEIIKENDMCLYNDQIYRKHHKFDGVVLKEKIPQPEKNYIENAYNLLPINWEIESNSVIELLENMEKLKNEHYKIISCNVDAIFYKKGDNYVYDIEQREIDRENYYPDRDGDIFDDFFPLDDYKIEENFKKIERIFDIGNRFDQYKKENFKKIETVKHQTDPYILILNDKILDFLNYAGCGKSYHIVNETESDKFVLVPEHSVRYDYNKHNIDNAVVEIFDHEFFLPMQKNIFVDEYDLMDTKYNYNLLIFALLGKKIECYGDDEQQKPVDYYELSDYFVKNFMQIERQEFENYRNNFTKEYYDNILNTLDYAYVENEIEKYRDNEPFKVENPENNNFIVCYTNEEIRNVTAGILNKYYGINMKNKDKYILNEYEIKSGMTFICKNTVKELSEHELYNKIHVKFIGFCNKNNELYVTLQEMNGEEKYSITFDLFSKNFYYNFALTLHCVQGMGIKYRVSDETIQQLIEEDVKDKINRKLYTLISRTIKK